MKATELMVGDWVFLPKENKPICVKSVCKTMIEPTPESDEDHYVIGDEYLEPIPITPEILKKNGFAHGEENELKDEYVFAENLKQIPQTVAEYTFYKHPISGCDSLLRCWTKCKDGDGQNDVHICSPRYVHELQHAFRLLGIVKDFRP